MKHSHQQAPIVTMTTLKPIGETFNLSIVPTSDAHESVFLFGLKKTDEEDRYIITSQTIYIQGDLIELDCAANELTDLDFSQLRNLKRLNCSYNHLPAQVDFSHLKELEYLNCSWNRLLVLDIRPLSNLEQLYCYYTELVFLVLGPANRLKILDCSCNLLTRVDFNQLKELEYLDCSGNSLRPLDLSQLNNLKWLDCSRNRISLIDLSQWAELNQLDLSYNNLSPQELLHICEELPDYSDRSNGAQGEITLSIQECTKVQPELSVLLPKKGWQLTEIDLIAELAELKELEKEEDEDDLEDKDTEAAPLPIVTMTTSKPIGESLYLTFSVDSEDSFALDYHRISLFGLERTDRGDRYTITSQTIQIQGDISELCCRDCQLTSLDVSQLTALGILDCANNQLTQLDLGQPEYLHFLNLSDNNFSPQELLRICEVLPVLGDSVKTVILINPESSRVQPEITDQILALLTHKKWQLQEDGQRSYPDILPIVG